MDHHLQEQAEVTSSRAPSRSFAKRIAETALALEVTGRASGPAAIEAAANEFVRAAPLVSRRRR